MKTLVVLILVVLLFGSGCSAASKSHNEASRSQAAKIETTPVEPTETASPDGTYQSDCDYQLGDFSETSHGYRFTADAILNNTGNVWTVTKVTATWFLAGGGKVTASKRVTVDPGHHRRVGITKVATSDQIDAYQNNSVGNPCKVIAAMVKAGDVPGQALGN